jgi:hypothetical protein
LLQSPAELDGQHVLGGPDGRRGVGLPQELQGGGRQLPAGLPKGLPAQASISMIASFGVFWSREPPSDVQAALNAC